MATLIRFQVRSLSYFRSYFPVDDIDVQFIGHHARVLLELGAFKGQLLASSVRRRLPSTRLESARFRVQIALLALILSRLGRCLILLCFIDQGHEDDTLLYASLILA